MNESQAKSSYVLAVISDGYCLYLGSRQANASAELQAYLTDTESRQRPSLLSTSNPAPLIMGEPTDAGLVEYSGPTSGEFLNRLRIYENKQYHWEIFRLKDGRLEILPEGHGREVKSSIPVGKRQSGVRWEQDNRQCRGTLNFGNFLGSGWLGFSSHERLCFEVISAKLNYETEYLSLIKDLSEKALSLILDFETPTNANLSNQQEKKQQTPLEAYLLLRAALPLPDFQGVLSMIKARPHSMLQSDERWMPSSLATGMHAMSDPMGRIRWAKHPKSGKPVATEVLERKRRDTTNTPPNQFTRLALEKFAENCAVIAADQVSFGSRNAEEAKRYLEIINCELRNEPFRTASLPGRIPFENQVLQKREGYKHVLRAWLLSSQALTARDLDADGLLSPTAENRHVPDLYEYWLFFFLAEALRGLEGATDVNEHYLGELNKDGAATIKIEHSDRPRMTILIPSEGKSRFVGLYYNRTFKKESGPSSYSMKLRPDYTLETFTDAYGTDYVHKRDNAARNGEITYLHFDAKFRIQKVGVKEIDGDAEEIDDLSAKPEDIYKMHTYNEAIRGTAASVILYPGNNPGRAEEDDELLSEIYRKYHELIPGVGALAIKPGDEKSRESALASLRKFILSAFGFMPDSKTHFTDFKKWEVQANEKMKDEHGTPSGQG